MDTNALVLDPMPPADWIVGPEEGTICDYLMREEEAQRKRERELNLGCLATIRWRPSQAGPRIVGELP